MSKKSKSPKNAPLVPLVLVPMYGYMRVAQRIEADHAINDYEISLRRDVYGASAEEILAFLETALAQRIIQKWRTDRDGTSAWVELDRALREHEGGFMAAAQTRAAKLRHFNEQSEAIAECAALSVQALDGRTLRGMLRQLASSAGEGVPPQVLIYKLGHDLAMTIRARQGNGFCSDWDTELAALTFGMELELELNHLETSAPLVAEDHASQGEREALATA